MLRAWTIFASGAKGLPLSMPSGLSMATIMRSRSWSGSSLSILDRSRRYSRPFSGQPVHFFPSAGIIRDLRGLSRLAYGQA